MNDIVLEILFSNKLTCPECGAQEKIEMDSEEKSRIYECDTCNEVIQSNDDECCICCQYGEVKCLPEQVKHRILQVFPVYLFIMGIF